jgi:hypothetical protein
MDFQSSGPVSEKDPAIQTVAEYLRYDGLDNGVQSRDHKGADREGATINSPLADARGSGQEAEHG